MGDRRRRGRPRFDGRKTTLRRTLQKASASLFLVLLGVVVGVAIAEVSARLIFFGSVAAPQSETFYRQLHSELGWSLMPNATSFRRTLDYINYTYINSKGFHDIEHSYEASDETYRIVVLGDSFMEAHTEPRTHSFAQFLARELAKRTGIDVEVMNLGVGGYGTTQEYLLYDIEGKKYEPDLVLLAFFPQNDVRNNVRSLESGLRGGAEHYTVAARPFLERDESGAWLLRAPDLTEAEGLLASRRESVLRREVRRQREEGVLNRLLVWKLLLRSLQVLDPDRRHISSFDVESMYGLYFDPYDERWVYAWDVTRELLRRFRDKVSETDGQLAVFSVPSAYEVDVDYWEYVVENTPGLAERNVVLDQPARILSDITEELGIPFCPLTVVFRHEIVQTGKKLHYMMEDLHWNRRGHEAAAQTVAAWLVESGYLHSK